MVYLIHFFKLRLIICVYCQICFPFIAIFFCPRYYYLRNIIENFIYIGWFTYNIGGLLLIEAAKATEVKKEAVKAEPKKETAKVTEVKKEAVKAEPKKEAAKVTPVKKEAVKAEPKKEAAKKTTTKKAAAKKVEKVLVQFYGKEFDVEALKEAAKADYTAKTGKKTVTSVELYIKPEDNRAYYVIDKATGFITL